MFQNIICCIYIQFSLTYISKGPFDNTSILVQEMAGRRPGDKLLYGLTVAQEYMYS